ncbi:nucleolar protein 56-like protein, partial [Tanacetum coccineum]
EIVGARLISHACSLTNLAKCPSSTLQILGAKKVLFRAMKTKGNTPKYGLIFLLSFTIRVFDDEGVKAYEIIGCGQVVIKDLESLARSS